MLQHKDEGFTLVELMTVVLVLSILTSIAIASFVSSSSMSERVACKSNQRILSEGVLEYRASHDGEDPEELSDLASSVRGFDRCSRCPADGRLLVFDAAVGAVTCTHEGH